MVSISVTPSASPSSKPSPTRSWATITSITTETVHPTYLFTLTESETVSRSVTSSAFAESSQTSRSAVDTHAIVETSSTTLDTPVTFTGSSIIMTSVMDVPLSTMSPSDPLAHLSGFNSLENAQSTSTYFEQPEATTSSTSSTSISITSASSSTAAASISPVISPFIGTVTGTISPDNSTSSTTTPFIGTVSSKVSPYKSPTSSNATESSPFFNTKDDKAIKPAVIVGIVIGVSALIMFALAGCFILRRRRQKIMKKQKIIGAQIKRPSFRSSLGLGYKTLHIRRAATPTTTRTIRTPTLPVIPEEAHTVPACSNDPFTHAHSNPDLSMDSLYLRSERLHRASYAQPGLTSGSPTDHSPWKSTSVLPHAGSRATPTPRGRMQA
ncbi:uncharacterized protein N7511_002770 [Penicillium nucicola]|uniref:uncharacterized protein n=1 Tax=Penicillium nucicola TaxID=1850975 RepID=UPI002545226A|nr:uncharacterized protein N7511_002770 [Penicillium nucicola]KAJ5770719.1 hypothetical protein N7511_002770 [Penicillium nucicola]